MFLSYISWLLSFSLQLIAAVNFQFFDCQIQIIIFPPWTWYKWYTYYLYMISEPPLRYMKNQWANDNYLVSPALFRDHDQTQTNNENSGSISGSGHGLLPVVLGFLKTWILIQIWISWIYSQSDLDTASIALTRTKNMYYYLRSHYKRKIFLMSWGWGYSYSINRNQS